MEGPSDRCPYARPFPEDFDACGAYQPVRFTPFDLEHNALNSVWSCGHLESAREPGAGFYGRCRLGDECSRAEWVERVQRERVATWRELAREFGLALAGPIAEVYGAKARQLELDVSSPERVRVGTELRAAVERFIEADFALLDSRAEELEEIGFPTEPMKIVTRAALDDLLTRTTVTGGWMPPDHLLEPFPQATRDFLVGLFQGPTAGDGQA